MSKVKEVTELLNKLSLLTAQIHYSYTKEEKFFVKVEKIFKDEEKLPAYLKKLSLSSGKIDKKKYKSFITECEHHRVEILNHSDIIKSELGERKNKNISCINSVGLVACKDLPEYATLTTSAQNLTYNFIVGTYIQGFNHFLDHQKGKRVNFKSIKDNLKTFLSLVKDVKNDKNVLSSNLPILETIEFDLNDLLTDFQDYENSNKIIIGSYDSKIKELLLTNTGSIKKVTE